MAKYKAGDRVMVIFDPGDQFTGNPARRYQGQEFVISKVREISYGNYGSLRGTEYYLEGAVSPHGEPYAFLEGHLAKL